MVFAIVVCLVVLERNMCSNLFGLGRGHVLAIHLRGSSRWVIWASGCTHGSSELSFISGH
jgi:hypothetical protein